jgi:hypothetical protein
METNTNKKCSVKNRSIGMVSYKIPEANIKRNIQPGETIVVDYDELVKLAYQPGGRELMEQYIQIAEVEARKDLGLKTELEYDMSEQDVVDLLTTGSLDQFLDALDFAPEGVITLIKALSVKLPLESTSKRKALKEKTGFDVDAALANSEPDDEDEEKVKSETHTRRVQPAATSSTPVRRTTPKYNVVDKKE